MASPSPQPSQREPLLYNYIITCRRTTYMSLTYNSLSIYLYIVSLSVSASLILIFPYIKRWSWIIFLDLYSLYSPSKGCLAALGLAAGVTQMSQIYYIYLARRSSQTQSSSICSCRPWGQRFCFIICSSSFSLNKPGYISNIYLYLSIIQSLSRDERRVNWPQWRCGRLTCRAVALNWKRLAEAVAPANMPILVCAAHFSRFVYRCQRKDSVYIYV